MIYLFIQKLRLLSFASATLTFFAPTITSTTNSTILLLNFWPYVAVSETPTTRPQVHVTAISPKRGSIQPTCGPLAKFQLHCSTGSTLENRPHNLYGKARLILHQGEISFHSLLCSNKKRRHISRTVWAKSKKSFSASANRWRQRRRSFLCLITQSALYRQK